jgi:hypothetical protein
METISSEYNQKYQEYDVSIYGGTGKRLSVKSKAPAPLAPVKLTYESTYDVMTAKTKSSSRKVNLVAKHAAHAAAVRTNKRRMSVAVEQAALAAREKKKAKQIQEPATDMHPELKRRFSMIAMEAAEKSSDIIKATPSKKKLDQLVFGEDPLYKSSTWCSTYDSGYQQPSYLAKMAKAAEAAAIAAVQFKREAGLCSEYLASFEDFEASEMASTCSKPTDMNQVGDCLDFTTAEKTNLKPSTHTFIPRRVAWSSEYAASFNEDDIDESQGAVIGVAPANSDGNRVMECLDWVGSTPSPAPTTTTTETTGTSMYSNDFKHYKYTPLAAYRPSAITEISSCFDWTKKVSAAAPVESDTKMSDDWVLVEKPVTKSNRAVIPGWGSVKSSEQMMTTYDWDYDGAWKKFRPSKKVGKKNKTKAGTKAAKADIHAAAKRANIARQKKIAALATQKGVAKQSASELFVAEKMLPFFATGSEYQKKFSVPAAVRKSAISKVVEKQKSIASKIRKINRPNTENNPILRGKRLGLQKNINMTSYQSCFGNDRQPSMKARIRALAAEGN